MADATHDDARRAFWRLALVNACVAVAGGATMLLGMPLGAVVIYGFPMLHLFWSLPMVAVAKRRGHTRARNGYLLATGVTLLLSAGCWVIVASRSRI